MSWHRNAYGLWCACFLTYRPDSGDGCPAYCCPEVPMPEVQEPQE